MTNMITLRITRGPDMNIFLYILHMLDLVDITTCFNGGPMHMYEWLSSYSVDGLCKFTDNPRTILGF